VRRGPARAGASSQETAAKRKLKLVRSKKLVGNPRQAKVELVIIATAPALAPRSRGTVAIHR